MKSVKNIPLGNVNKCRGQKHVVRESAVIATASKISDTVNLDNPAMFQTLCMYH